MEPISLRFIPGWFHVSQLGTQTYWDAAVHWQMDAVLFIKGRDALGPRKTQTGSSLP